MVWMMLALLSQEPHGQGFLFLDGYYEAVAMPYKSSEGKLLEDHFETLALYVTPRQLRLCLPTLGEAACLTWNHGRWVGTLHGQAGLVATPISSQPVGVLDLWLVEGQRKIRGYRLFLNPKEGWGQALLLGEPSWRDLNSSADFLRLNDRRVNLAKVTFFQEGRGFFLAEKPSSPIKMPLPLGADLFPELGKKGFAKMVQMAGKPVNATMVVAIIGDPTGALTMTFRHMISLERAKEP